MSTLGKVGAAVLATMVVGGGAAAIALNEEAPSPPVKRSGTATPTRPVYRMETDHATYSDSAALREDADVIVIGRVLAHHVVPGTSPGTDAAGDPLPAMPHTDYAVKVISVIKGANAHGETLVVSISGGAGADADFILEGGPDLSDGKSAMFFLRRASDGKYYPLAGGAAVAVEHGDGSYALTNEVTGARGQTLASAFTGVTIGNARVVLGHKRRATVDVACPALSKRRCSGRLRIEAKIRRHGKKQRVKSPRVPFEIAAGQTSAVKVTVARVVAQHVRKNGLAVQVVAFSVDARGRKQVRTVRAVRLIRGRGD